MDLDPDSNLNLNDIVGIINKYIGFCETHELETEDGYTLTLFRIPRENPKDVILLQHPIFFDARIWVNQYDNSIAFYFWRAGYDVWLGNVRGTMFCRKHKTWETTSRKFWDFSFHEMGYYDHDATIEYIKQKCNCSKIIYLGISMGATSGLAYASTRSENCGNSVKVMVTIAPVSHMGRGTSIVKYIVPPFCRLLKTFKIDLRRTFFRPNSWYIRTSRFLCTNMFSTRFVNYLVGLVGGFGDEPIDAKLLYSSLKIFGTEIPLKLWVHFNEIFITGGNFAMFNYGEEKNLEVYYSRQAPFYPLDKIKIPVLLVYGENDIFACVEDQEFLYSELGKTSNIHRKLSIQGFSHFDFTVHSKRDERAFNTILQILDEL